MTLRGTGGYALAAALALTGTALLGFGMAVPGPPQPDPTDAGRAASAGAGRGAASAGALAAAGRPPAPGTAPIPGRLVPVHLDIPGIDVHTPLIEIGLNPDGTVAVPPLEPDAPAGWYRYLAAPGEAGPAVILGHVDSRSGGPAVFYALGRVRPGDPVTVRRADGVVVAFTVTGVARYPKSDFPTAAVYGPTNRPELRLVTCGGLFDRGERRYRDVVVVYAALAPG